MFSRLATWMRYPDESRRDLRLDFLRGYCVFMMIVDHLSGQSYWYWLTGNNRFIISAAEGFVFISGLVMAMVYRPTAERLGFERIFMQAISRAFQLYLLFVGLTFAMLGFALIVGSPNAIKIDDPVTFALGVITMHQSAYLTDVMLFYTLAVAMAPLAFLFMRQRQTLLLLAISLLVWGMYQFYPDLAYVPWVISRQDAFPFAAWQLLFVLGLAAGYHQELLKSFFGRIHPILLLGGLVILLAALLAFMRYDARIAGAIGGPTGAFIGDMFYKFDVRPGRVVGLVVVFGLCYLFLTAFWRPVQFLTGWLFLTLGQHALDAYSVHIFFVIALSALRVRSDAVDALDIVLNTVLQSVILLLIWALLRFGAIDFMMGRQRRVSRPAPAAVTT